MVTWDTTALNDYESRQLKQKPRQQPQDQDTTRESEIQRSIVDYCKSRGWLVVWQRMDRATTTEKGTVDLVIAADGAVTWWVEVKRPGGKLTVEQLAKQAHLKRLGHRNAVVHSLREFVALVCGVKQEQFGPDPQRGI